MLTRSLLLVVVFMTLVNCSSDKKTNAAQPRVADTPTVITDEAGKEVEQILPPGATKPTEVTQKLTYKAWMESGFDKDILLELFIGPEICSLGEKQYVGCFFAAKSLVQSAYGDDTILVVDGQQNSTFIGEKIKSVGLFAVHKEIKPPAIKRNDLVARSAFAKKEDVFFKTTVKVLIQQYKSKVAPLAVVEKAKKIYQEEFAALVKKADAAIIAKDTAAAQKEFAVLEAKMQAARKSLVDIFYKDYVEFIDLAFTNIPEEQKASRAADVYNTYLRHSVDGHAGIDLSREAKAIIDQAQASNLYGIGVMVYTDEEDPSLIYFEPRDKSSALAAGVKINDRLVSVGTVKPTTLDQAIGLIKGPKGTEVTITLERWGTKELVTFTIQRQPITLGSYEFSQKTVNGKLMGVLKINTFMDDKMASAVREFVSKNDALVDGWLLNLQNNGGGLVTQAQELLSVFLPKGTPTAAFSKPDQLEVVDEEQRMFTELEQVTRKKLVVIINANSASASELTSGILQENQRALIVGERSFGKGSAQVPGQPAHIDLPHFLVWTNFPKVLFKKTVGRYFFASGRTPEWVGVQPDIRVSTHPEVSLLFEPREQDVIPFSLGGLGEPWKQTRGEYVQNIEGCVLNSGVETKKWTAEESQKPFAMDYALLYALDALKCM